jgi:hypothetical protein
MPVHTNIDGNEKFLGLKRSAITGITKGTTERDSKAFKSTTLSCKIKLKRNRNHRPKAPHNTTQYLSAIPWELELAETDIDDICITGGTMKGIFSLINIIDSRYDTDLADEHTEDTENVTTPRTTSFDAFTQFQVD